MKETQRALCQAAQHIRANGLCRGPKWADGSTVCVRGALGFTELCSGALDSAARCGGVRLNPDGVVRGGCEAARLASAEIMTRWMADDDEETDIECDFFAFEPDLPGDLEVLGDLCYLASDVDEVASVLDAASEKAAIGFRYWT